MIKAYATAILMQAVIDLHSCVKYGTHTTDCNINELHRFFESEYADLLLTVSGINISGKELIKVVEHNAKRKNTSKKSYTPAN